MTTEFCSLLINSFRQFHIHFDSSRSLLINSLKQFHKHFDYFTLQFSLMGPANSDHQLLSSALEKCDFSNPLWRNRPPKLQTKNAKCRSVVMKRRARLDRRARPRNAIERKLRTLKKLIPNCESMGVGRLFRETADYILALQMRVKVMQIVVDALSGSDDDDDDE